MNDFVEIQEFSDKKHAENLIWLLSATDIQYKIEKKETEVENCENTVIVKIRIDDIERVNKLINDDDFYKNDENKLFEYQYLYSLSDKDILGIISNSLAWTEKEIKIAKEIAKNRKIQSSNAIINNNSAKNIDKKIKFEKEEDKWRKSYNSGFLFFIFFFIISFFSSPVVTVNELYNKEQLVLETNPEYKSFSGKNSRYWIVLKFQGDNDNYEINGIDYKYVNHQQFKNDIKGLDTINIGFIDRNIYLLSKNGYQYCDIDKSNKHKSRNILFVKIISFISMIVMLIPIFMDKKPKISLWIIWAIIIGLTLIVIFSLDIVSMNDLTLSDFK